MGTDLAGRRVAPHQLTETLDLPEHDLCVQRPSERLTARRLLETSRRVPTQPRTASRARADDQFPDGSH
jgi:hypothetical protein